MSDKPRTQSGLSVKTLLIAGAASASAAYVVPLFWRPGTVFAAAMTPVIVTVVSELLNRPADTVSKVASRKTTGGAVVFEEPPRRAEEPFDPLAPATPEELEALPRTTSQRAVHRRGLTGRQWRAALITAAIAFVGAVTFVTASELLAGETPGSSNNPTTFFGNSSRRDTDETPTPTPTPSETPEEEETATPTPTPSATATPTPTPTPTATPTPATAAPQATPAPATPTPTP